MVTVSTCNILSFKVVKMSLQSEASRLYDSSWFMVASLFDSTVLISDEGAVDLAIGDAHNRQLHKYCFSVARDYSYRVFLFLCIAPYRAMLIPQCYSVVRPLLKQQYVTC